MVIDLFETITFSEKPRGYIGCSVIGHACYRYIWLNKYGKEATEIPFRRKRIFERGHWEEGRILSLIEKTGEFSIEGTQVLASSGDEPVLKGHADAILRHKDGTRYLLEIKTMNSRGFKALCRQGLKRSHFSYWSQVQTYLYLLLLNTAIVIAVNKNDESLHEEVIDIEPSVGAHLVDKAKRISEQTEMPLGLAYHSTKQLECYGCSFEKLCYQEGQKDVQNVN